MTARKPATKSAVAASRASSSTVKHAASFPTPKPLASFKADPTIRATETGRISSHTPHHEDAPRAIHQAASQAASALVSTAPVVRDSLPASVERAFESIRSLYTEIEHLDDTTVPLRSYRQSAPSMEFDFAPERNLLESLNMINAHIRTATARITELREQLDV